LQVQDEVSLVELYGHSTRVALPSQAAQREHTLPVPL
jgi:hypothetical protein